MLTKPFIELPLKGLVEDVLANSLDLMGAGGDDWVVAFSPSLGPLVTRYIEIFLRRVRMPVPSWKKSHTHIFSDNISLTASLALGPSVDHCAPHAKPEVSFGPSVSIQLDVRDISQLAKRPLLVGRGFRLSCTVSIVDVKLTGGWSGFISFPRSEHYVATPPSVPVALPPAAIPPRSTPLRSTRRCVPSGFALSTARPLAPPIVTLDLSTSLHLILFLRLFFLIFSIFFSLLLFLCLSFPTASPHPHCCRQYYSCTSPLYPYRAPLLHRHIALANSAHAPTSLSSFLCMRP